MSSSTRLPNNKANATIDDLFFRPAKRTENVGVRWRDIYAHNRLVSSRPVRSSPGVTFVRADRVRRQYMHTCTRTKTMPAYTPPTIQINATTEVSAPPPPLLWLRRTRQTNELVISIESSSPAEEEGTTTARRHE